MNPLKPSIEGANPNPHIHLADATANIPVPAFKHVKDDDYELTVDNSAMDIIKGCPREAYFYLVQRRGRGDTAATTMGSAVHEALEYLYRDGLHPDNLTQAYDIINQYYMVKNITDEWRGPTFACQVIQHYVNRHSSEPFEILVHENKYFIERPFRIGLGEMKVNAELEIILEGETIPVKRFVKNLTIFITGKIDLGIKNEREEKFVFDHKTASRLGDTFWSKFALSPQFKTYGWAFKQIFGEFPKGAIVNVLVCRKPTRTGTSIAFERQTFHYSHEMYREWEVNTLHTLRSFIAIMMSHNYPPNDANCVRIYGKCPYMGICTLEPKHRLAALRTSEFPPVQWDPTK